VNVLHVARTLATPTDGFSIGGLDNEVVGRPARTEARLESGEDVMIVCGSP